MLSFKEILCLSNPKYSTVFHLFRSYFISSIRCFSFLNMGSKYLLNLFQIVYNASIVNDIFPISNYNLLPSASFLKSYLYLVHF